MGPVLQVVEAELVAEVDECLPRNAFPLEIFEALLDRHIQSQGGQVPKKGGFLTVSPQVLRQTFCPSDFQVPISSVGGDAIQMRVPGKQRRSRFSTPGRNTWKTVGGITNEAQIIWNRFGSNAPLRPNAVLVDGDFPPPIEHDHSISNHTLSQVLVRGQYHHSINIVGEPPGHRGQGIVRFELFHLPYDHPERLQGPFRKGKLRQDVRIQALPRLVPVVQIVSKRPDHLVGRSPQVSNVRLAQQRQGRFDEANHSLDVTTVGGLAIGTSTEERPEQFIGSIE